MDMSNPCARLAISNPIRPIPSIPIVHHATIGIVGMGRIGFEMAKRAHGFDMSILYTDERHNEQAESKFGARHVDFDTLLSDSDFVTLHTPLTPETRHLVSAPQLARM